MTTPLFTTKELRARVVRLAARPELNFIELGACLDKLREAGSPAFGEAIDAANLDRRMAYYLAEVSRILTPLGLPQDRLTQLGWTKVQVLAKQITAENAEELLSRAEWATVRDLQNRARRGSLERVQERCVLLYLTDDQYAELEAALVTHGARKRGRGLQGKEDALIQLLRATQAISSDRENQVETV